MSCPMPTSCAKPFGTLLERGHPGFQANESFIDPAEGSPERVLQAFQLLIQRGNSLEDTLDRRLQTLPNDVDVPTEFLRAGGSLS